MTKPSITMTVKKGVTVVRDGKRVRPEIGKTFDFTAEERDSILGVDPAALAKATGGEEKGEAETASTETAPSTTAGTSTAPSSAEASQTAAKNGTKEPTANKSDKEVAAEKSGDDDL